MLYNVLIKDAVADPRNQKAKDFFDQYEKQRDHFLNIRLSELEKAYGLSSDEKAVLLGFFNTFEREDQGKGSDRPATFNLLSIFKQHKDKDELAGKEPTFSASLGWLRVYWSGAWRQFANFNKYSLSARHAIKNFSYKDISTKYEAVAIDDLISDLKEVLPSAEKLIGLPCEDDFHATPKVSANGILSTDAKKLKWLQQNNIGKHTKEYITSLNNLICGDKYDIEHRLDIWDNPLYFSKCLAELRWKDRIAKLVQRKQDNVPALSYQFFNQVNGITKRGNLLDSTETSIIDSNGKHVSAFNKTPGTTISIMEQITKSNLPLLSSITSHYLWRWFIIHAHKQHLLDQEQPYKMDLFGGYARLGELSGAGQSKAARSRIKKIIDMTSMCSYLYEGKAGIYRGNLLSFEHFEAYGQKSSRLIVSLARPLCPGFVEELPDGNSKYSHQKILIPWVKMPVLVGKNSAHHAPQSSFQLDMNAQMRLRAPEIYERGGILLNDDNMLELAKGAKLSADLYKRVLDVWIQEEYLEKVDDCMFMLGNRYPEARESLRAAGEMTIKSSERGRKRKTAKRSKLIAESKK